MGEEEGKGGEVEEDVVATGLRKKIAGSMAAALQVRTEMGYTCGRERQTGRDQNRVIES